MMMEDRISLMVNETAFVRDSQLEALDLAELDVELAQAIMREHPGPSAAASPERTRSRVAMFVGAAAALIVAAVGVSMLSSQEGDSVAWAATPEAISVIEGAEILAGCNSVSTDLLADPVATDVRGNAGAALFQVSESWIACTFRLVESGLVDVTTTTILIPELQPSGEVSNTSAISGMAAFNITPVSIGTDHVDVIAGLCLAQCESITFETELGSATANADPDGLFIAWVPSATFLRVSGQVLQSTP